MNRKSKVNVDPGSIASQTYNQASGAQKNAEVGRSLKPLDDGAGGFTTSAATARALPSAGRNLAIYNNAGAVGAITLGKSAAEVATALAPGVCDSTAHVGIPCAPNDWTFVACNENNWIKSTAATLLVFLIEDDTSK